MTKLLEYAYDQVRALSEEDQDMVAWQILQVLRPQKRSANNSGAGATERTDLEASQGPGPNDIKP